MNIKDLYQLNDTDRINITALLSNKNTEHTKDNKAYLKVIIQDKTGTLEFPIWDNYEINNTLLNVNSVYNVIGTVGHYNDMLQIKSPRLILVPDSAEIDITDYMPRYDIPEALIQYFNSVLTNMSHKYKIVAQAATGALGYDGKRWKAFTTCVSATKHHGNKIGGLFLHTVGVMKAVESMIEKYVDNPFFTDASKVINKDRLMLKAILHDLKKDEEYEYKGSIKRKKVKYDHTVNGVSYLIKINEEIGNLLDEEEIQDIGYSILSHHGQWGNFEPKEIEDTLLHLADMVDSKIVGAAENYERIESK